MAEDWTPDEVAATVADYLEMLELELRGTSYNKKEHNRSLQNFLNRTPGAIEFKHQNISAVLIELGLPYIEGYRPRGNYQALLRDKLIDQLAHKPEIETATAAIVDAIAAPVRSTAIPDRVFVDPPSRENPGRIYERRVFTNPTRIDYLERESRNRSLGEAGELFVLEVEHHRLRNAGCKHLAARIEHVSKSLGDGLGYDVKSYEIDGRERLIEVKTTAFGPLTPFFASAKEVKVSEDLPTFQLYRVFKFRDSPLIFRLPGALRRSCSLKPSQFKASLV